MDNEVRLRKRREEDAGATGKVSLLEEVHEYEELKEGIWLELALALLRKKTNEDWTGKHRNVARKVFLGGGWVQKRLFDIGWPNMSLGGMHRKAKALSLPRMERGQT